MAVIDIGSNSVRLLVYEAAKRNPVPLFNEKVLCGLGRSLATTGRLGDEAVECALRALRRYMAIAERLGATSVNVLATAAAREAENGPDFVRRAKRIVRTEISVLTGKQEAYLAAAGVISGLHYVDGMAADLGGGSLEIIDIRDGEPAGGITLPLGGLRLIDLSGGDLGKARAIVDAELNKAEWLKQGRGRPFYAVGGTWRAFARLHMTQKKYPLGVMHGYRIPIQEAVTFARVLDHLSPSSLEGVEAISRARRETVPYGALILERLIRIAEPSEFVVSAFGVREGLLYNLLRKKEQKRDPLLAACDEFAGLRSRSRKHAHELCAWTDALFQPPGPEETAEERRLRHAACLLSDIGWRAHPDYRGTESMSIIAQASFGGIDHPGRAFLALTIYYRHQGMLSEEASPILRELVDSASIERARILGAAIRAAHMLSAAMPGVIPHTPVSYEDDRLVLHLPRRFEVLGGERLEARFKRLARRLRRAPEIRIAEKKKAAELAG